MTELLNWSVLCEEMEKARLLPSLALKCRSSILTMSIESKYVTWDCLIYPTSKSTTLIKPKSSRSSFSLNARKVKQT